MVTDTLYPYLTIVVCARNDNHGGNLLGRLQAFVTGLLEQCRRHRIRAELVLVEWNPPADRPKLIDMLHWPCHDGSCSVRVIEVPREVHQRFQHAKALPLFQMMAKNVGIRRAVGTFILATNVDILFSDELMRFLASGDLRPRSLYRVDRHDVPSDVLAHASIDQQLDFCKRNAFRVCSRNGTRNLDTGELHRIYSPVPFVSRRLDWIRSLLLRSPFRGSRVLEDHARLRTRRARLHTNASGDFTLMAKDRWFELRGYPELEMFSFHIDSLLCYMAHHAGLREVVLRYPIFHIEHSGGWTPAAERDKSLYTRLSEARIPRLTNDQFDALAVQMRRERRPLIFNDEAWGLANEELPEVTPYPSNGER